MVKCLSHDVMLIILFRVVCPGSLRCGRVWIVLLVAVTCDVFHLLATIAIFPKRYEVTILLIHYLLLLLSNRKGSRSRL